MKYLLLILLFFKINLLFSQEMISTEFPNLELTYENEVRNSETYIWEKVTFTNANPEMSYEFKHHDRTMLVAFFFGEPNGAANLIVTYLNFADTWQPINQKKFEYGQVYKELKFLNTEKTKYVHFEYMAGDDSTDKASHTFALFDIINNELYELTYKGQNDYEKDYTRVRNGTFELNNLLEHPEILHVLENQAKESKYIVRN
jgi:hypothetical protein